MKSFPIPVRSIGPGSQPDEDEPLNFLPLPSTMASFAMPQVPERVDPRVRARVRDALAAFQTRWSHWNGAGEAALDLAPLDEAAIDILNEVLGRGEVSIRLRAQRSSHPPLQGEGRGGDGLLRAEADAGEVRIQETVFAGVWRLLRYDGRGGLRGDTLIAAPMPRVVVDAARSATAADLARVELPAGAMNSPALLTEIRDNVKRRHARPARDAHVINLSLLPLTPEDHQVLNRALPIGPVAIMSKSFGNCRVTSTGTRDVWRVQYFNSMQTMILNTIEIVDIPEVALASADDLADSRTRLADLIDWLDESADAEPVARAAE